MSFNQAVYSLTGRDVTNMRSSDFPKKQAPQYTSPPRAVQTEKEKKVLRMPEQAPTMRQMFAYLCKTRKIPCEIVEELVHAKLLYQSQNIVNATINGVPQTFKNANAVFVHRNEKGEACHTKEKTEKACTGEKESTGNRTDDADGTVH